MDYWKRHLHALILIFIIAGILLGSLFNALNVPTEAGDTFLRQLSFTFFQALDLLGTIFLAALKMVIIPVIVTSIAFGLGGMSKGAKVGRIAGRTIVYYICTTAIAVMIGLALVLVFQPGEGEQIAQTVAGMLENDTANQPADIQAKIDRARGQIRAEGLEGLEGYSLMLVKLKNLAISLVPDNIAAAMARGQFLPIIVFSILLGVILFQVRDRTPALLKLVEEAQTLFFALLEAIMWLAPIGFFAIVAKLCWTVGLEGISTIWIYGVAVVLGLLLHGLVVLPLILRVFGKRSPWTYAKQLQEALIMAFSTASSSATLPVTLENVEKNAGVSKDSASFVLPLGATVNMDGTAMYESIALVTLIQAYAAATGIDAGLGLGELFVIFITVTLAAIGAAGLPGAGIFMLIMMMTTVKVGDQVGLPPYLIGLILVIDRPLDMLRTCVNVWGDSVGCAVVDRLEHPDAPVPGD